MRSHRFKAARPSAGFRSRWRYRRIHVTLSGNAPQHAHPETAFEETRTSDIVAEKLESFGIEVHRGLAKTGVVGTLVVGNSNRAIGLRADLDALDILEENTFEHVSTHPGKMHACGHDGHASMLLGAAKLLKSLDEDGTCRG